MANAPSTRSETSARRVAASASPPAGGRRPRTRRRSRAPRPAPGRCGRSAASARRVRELEVHAVPELVGDRQHVVHVVREVHHACRGRRPGRPASRTRRRACPARGSASIAAARRRSPRRSARTRGEKPPNAASTSARRLVVADRRGPSPIGAYWSCSSSRSSPSIPALPGTSAGRCGSGARPRRASRSTTAASQLVAQVRRRHRVVAVAAQPVDHQPVADQRVVAVGQHRRRCGLQRGVQRLQRRRPHVAARVVHVAPAAGRWCAAPRPRRRRTAPRCVEVVWPNSVCQALTAAGSRSASIALLGLRQRVRREPAQRDSGSGGRRPPRARRPARAARSSSSASHSSSKKRSAFGACDQARLDGGRRRSLFSSLVTSTALRSVA